MKITKNFNIYLMDFILGKEYISAEQMYGPQCTDIGGEWIKVPRRIYIHTKRWSYLIGKCGSQKYEWLPEGKMGYSSNYSWFVRSPHTSSLSLDRMAYEKDDEI